MENGAELRRLCCLKIKGKWLSSERVMTVWISKRQLKVFLKQQESVCCI